MTAKREEVMCPGGGEKRMETGKKKRSEDPESRSSPIPCQIIREVRGVRGCRPGGPADQQEKGAKREVDN